jgi:hypothetical protein
MIKSERFGGVPYCCKSHILWMNHQKFEFIFNEYSAACNEEHFLTEWYWYNIRPYGILELEQS